MAEKGGQPGNQNAVKGRMFYAALRKCLVQEPHRMRTIVENLVTAAEDGEQWAVKELIDRVDGKAVQANTLEDGEGNSILSGIQVTFVTPNE